MSKKKILIISIISFILISAAVVSVLYFSGKLSFKNDKSDDYIDYTETESVTHNQMPLSPSAVMINGEADVSSISEYGVNTVIINFDIKNQTSVLQNMNTANNHNIFCGVRVSKNDFEVFLNLFDDLNPDFVILYDYKETDKTFFTNASSASKRIHALDGSVLIGLEPTVAEGISGYFKDLSEGAWIDFIYVNQKNSPISIFTSAALKWSEIPTDIWLCYNIENIKDFKNSDTQAVIDSASEFQSQTQYKAFAFSDLNSLISADNEQAKTIKSYIVKREKYLEDKEFSLFDYTENTITVEMPIINFKGTCSPLSELKCNGEILSTASNGDFSFDISLNAGDNTVTFEHKGKSYTYTVFYKVKLLSAVSPTSALSVPGDMELEFSATALNGSSVTLYLGDKNYTMKPSASYTDEDFDDSVSQFVTYSVTVTTPKGKTTEQNLGAFKVTATKNGVSETMTGASVKIAAEENFIIPAVIKPTEVQNVETTKKKPVSTTRYSQRTATTAVNEDELTTKERANTSAEALTSSSTSSVNTTISNNQTSLQKYSYQKNYGLGTAKIVEITDNYAECYPGGKSTSTNSSPDCSPLLKGTTDYYLKAATLDDSTYYYLSTGYKVPVTRKDNEANGKVTVYQLKTADGYIMPSNNIEILSCNYTDNKTVIRIGMNRKVVFNARLIGQSYSDNGYGRNVKVTAPNFTGIEFTFYDTTRVSGSLSFSGPIVANGTTAITNNTAKLKLNFSAMGKFYGYHAEYDSSGNLVITIKNKPSSIAGYTIMIDPGHGGRDGGTLCAVSSSSWNEAKINLSLAQKIKQYLEAEGATVIMTRNDNTFVSLTARNNLVRRYLPDLFISVHCDASSSSSSAYGTTAYYYKAYSQPLAKYVHEAIVSTYRNQIYSGSSRTGIDRGTLFGAYKVARVEECPSILVEYGFLTNVSECQALQNSGCRDALARATVSGIKNYIAKS